MNFLFNSLKKPATLELTISTSSPQHMIITVKDKDKPDTFYIKREGTVKGKRTFYLKLPQTPNHAIVSVYNKRFGNLQRGADPTFKLVDRKVTRLGNRVNRTGITRNGTKDFVKFAQEFSERAGISDSNRSIYKSDDGRFTIVYLPVIKDYVTGIVLKTPARISREKGIIEVSKAHFSKYTVPMRMAILLHEFSHFYLNKVQSDESEADLNGLLIYLSMGYPRHEGHMAFIQVFKSVPTPENKDRFEKIKKFINNFEKFRFNMV